MLRRWVLLVAIVVLIPFGAYSQELDFAPAPPAAKENYLSKTEYRDDTLHVMIEDVLRDDSIYHIARVTITDPSQLRTAISSAPGEETKAITSDMARAANAVVAINGDNFLYRHKGIIIRQGAVLRDHATTDLDMLVIDKAGNFHALRKPTAQSIEQARLTLDIAQWFTFGPVLVLDGQQQVVYNNYGFAPQDKAPRTAIGQTGPLSYVLVAVDGRQKQSRGVTHKQLAKMMADLGCSVAFNLDGGGSSTMMFGGVVYNSLMSGEERDNSDIIYFATGADTAQ